MAVLLVVTSSCVSTHGHSLCSNLLPATPTPRGLIMSRDDTLDTLQSAWEGADESGNQYMWLWLGQLLEPLRLDFPQNLCTHRSVPDPAGTPQFLPLSDNGRVPLASACPGNTGSVPVEHGEQRSSHGGGCRGTGA